jgi:hypothetical protein
MVNRYDTSYEETDALIASLRSDFEKLTEILDEMLPEELKALIVGADRLTVAARQALTAQGGARPDAVVQPPTTKEAENNRD